MKKIPYVVLTIAVSAVLNFAVWLMLAYTSFGERLPEQLHVAGPIFIFVVSVWYFLTRPLRGKD